MYYDSHIKPLLDLPPVPQRHTRAVIAIQKRLVLMVLDVSLSQNFISYFQYVQRPFATINFRVIYNKHYMTY